MFPDYPPSTSTFFPAKPFPRNPPPPPLSLIGDRLGPFSPLKFRHPGIRLDGPKVSPLLKGSLSWSKEDLFSPFGPGSFCSNLNFPHPFFGFVQRPKSASVSPFPFSCTSPKEQSRFYDTFYVTNFFSRTNLRSDS